jgi:glucose uptake protein GlcU
MVILYLLGLMGWVAIIFIIFGICFRDYTKENKKEKIDDFLLKP